jgi:hypothetical protein
MDSYHYYFSRHRQLKGHSRTSKVLAVANHTNSKIKFCTEIQKNRGKNIPIVSVRCVLNFLLVNLFQIDGVLQALYLFFT